MITNPTYVSVPEFGTSATLIPPTSPTYDDGYTPGVILPTENLSFFFNGFSANDLTQEGAIAALIVELTNILTAAGITPDSAVHNQILNSLYILFVKASGGSTLTGTTTVGGTLTSSGGTFSGSWAGSPTFSGAVALSGGGSMAGTFSGNPTFSGTVTLSGGGSMAGTFSGNPTFSGTILFSGSVTFNPGLTAKAISGVSANSQVAMTQYKSSFETGTTFNNLYDDLSAFLGFVGGKAKISGVLSTSGHTDFILAWVEQTRILPTAHITLHGYDLGSGPLSLQILDGSSTACTYSICI